QAQDDVDELLGDRALRALPLVELRELLLRGQLAAPDEVRDLLERAVRRELLDRVAPIRERGGLLHDLRDAGGVDDATGQSLLDVLIGHWCPSWEKLKTAESNALYAS